MATTERAERRMSIPVITWHGAYDVGWKGLICDQAFAHPAKAGRGLLEHIFNQLFALGALKRGDIVCDPFGGIGTTAIIGARRGVQVVCVELEEKFVDLARQNVEMHRADWEAMGWPIPAVLQGDSRRLRAVLRDADIAAVVASPPYVSGGHHSDQTGAWNQNGRGQGGTRDQAGYGDADGQLGRLRAGDVDAVIGSPPYEESLTPGNRNSSHEHRQNLAERAGHGRLGGGQLAHGTRYSFDPANVGNLPAGDVDAIVASPPYSTGCVREGSPCDDASHLEGSGASLVVPRPGVPTGSVDAVISSPPFLGARSDTERSRQTKHGGPAAERHHTTQAGAGYGESDGNLANLRAGDVDAIVSSPPFAQGYKGGGGINRKGYGPDGADKVGERTYQGTGAERSDGNLETAPLGNVDAVLGSPPWGNEAEGCVRGSKFADPTDALKANRGKGCSDEARLRQLARDEDKTYGESEGQLAAMPDRIWQLWPCGARNDDRSLLLEFCPRHGMRPCVPDADAVVSSPPYEGSLKAANDGIDWEKAKKRSTSSGGEHQAPGVSIAAAYPANADNLGNRTGETFWSAALLIVRETYAVLKPGGHAVWIVKAFVRDGKIQDFPGDWRRLCEHAGFETILEARAMLVKEERRPDLFDGEVVTKKARKSFFRRLYESRFPHNAIDFETVWFMVKR